MNIYIGIEGACLTGKSTLIKKLSNELANFFNVIEVDEYTKFAGGHNHMPQIWQLNDVEAEKAAMFFLMLESKRKKNIESKLKYLNPKRINIILIDRLFLSCIRVAELTNNAVAKRLYEKALNRKQFLKMDIILLLPPLDDDTRSQRILSREMFPGSEIVYQQCGYNEFILKNFSNFSVDGTIYEVDSDKINEILLMIFTLVEFSDEQFKKVGN